MPSRGRPRSSRPRSRGGAVLGALALIVASLTLLSLSGCVCQPVLEVTSCRPDDPRCRGVPSDDGITEWTAEHAQAWPQLDALLRGLETGEHAHPRLDGGPEAFWRHFGIDPTAPEKELWIRHEGGTYLVRVPEC